MRKLKYTCLPECHSTLIDMPGINQWEPSIACTTCGRTSFFMTVVALPVPEPEPDIDVDGDPTQVRPSPWQMNTGGDV